MSVVVGVEGILPIAKSTRYGAHGWGLPGHGEAYADCGTWRYEGCLNVEAHDQARLFEDYKANQVYLHWFKRSCFRSECPVCYEKWAGRAAGRIENRLLAYGPLSKVIHVIVSPGPGMSKRPFRELRHEATAILKRAGFRGGSLIIHVFRQRKSDKSWYVSRHFHGLGFGWIKGTKELFERYGWVVKNAGLRKTVVGTALYQLSHSGVHKKHHTITWIGELSYNKLRHVQEPVMEKETCPICGSELRPVLNIGAWRADVEGYGWRDAADWVYKPRRESGG